MEDDTHADRRRLLAGMRRLGATALRRFAIAGARLRLVRHEQNTTFQVTHGDDRYVLRVNRPGVHDAATVASEMAWLRALRRDTDLGVPLPVGAPDGSPVVVLPGPDGQPRVCVLLHWQDGRFVDRRLAPRHLGQVGWLMGGLQRHAAGWTHPVGFARPRVDTLTAAAKVASVGPGLGDPGPWPALDDGDRAATLVARLVSEASAPLVARSLDVVRATTSRLDREPGAAGLIHGDLHQENFLFDGEVARAIDFDDCGWGFHLYDLAVTLSEVDGRPHFPALRDALLDAYARRQPLPADYGHHLQALMLLRRLQLVLWILESRQHAAFRDRWRPWATEELEGVEAAQHALG